MITIQNIRQAVQHLLTGRKQRQAFNQAVSRVYTTFAQKYPQWEASYFDYHFLTHTAAPLLVQVKQGADSVQGYALAEVWSQQMSWYNEKTRQKLIVELTPVATDFLLLLEAEFRIHEPIGEWDPQAA
jgi:hypothetical protein